MTNKQMEELDEMLLEDQPLSPEDEELVRVIYDRLDMFEEKNRPYHEEAKKCRKILHMEDPDQDDPVLVEENGKKTTIPRQYN